MGLFCFGSLSVVFVLVCLSFGMFVWFFVRPVGCWLFVLVWGVCWSVCSVALGCEVLLASFSSGGVVFVFVFCFSVCPVCFVFVFVCCFVLWFVCCFGLFVRVCLLFWFVCVFVCLFLRWSVCSLVSLN